MASLISGCASMPPLDFSYFPARGVAQVAVTQTFDCSTDKKRLVVVTTSPTVTAQYSADRTQSAIPLQLSKVRGDLTDTEFTIGYYEDGRLKSINLSSTGQGEAVLKSVISTVGAAIPLVGGSDAGGEQLPECTEIENWGKGKPVAISFAASVPLTKEGSGTTSNMLVSPDGAPLFAKLNRAAPQVKLTLLGQPFQPARLTGATRDYVPLRLQMVDRGNVVVSIDGTPIFDGDVAVPLKDFYSLPLPKAALFGKNALAVSVDGSGAVTSIQYSKTTGDSGAWNALSAALAEAAPDSTATKASAVKAEADLIAQAQRLARCKAQPSNCQ